jgi:hypothetical protein
MEKSVDNRWHAEKKLIRLPVPGKGRLRNSCTTVGVLVP